LYADDLVEGVVVTEWGKGTPPIGQAFDAWERECDRRFDTLKANEEELNRIFIDILRFTGRTYAEVEDKDVTVRRADLGREIAQSHQLRRGCVCWAVLA
jgi:hypothetical protein